MVSFQVSKYPPSPLKINPDFGLLGKRRGDTLTFKITKNSAFAKLFGSTRPEPEKIIDKAGSIPFQNEEQLCEC